MSRTSLARNIFERTDNSSHRLKALQTTNNSVSGDKINSKLRTS